MDPKIAFVVGQRLGLAKRAVNGLAVAPARGAATAAPAAPQVTRYGRSLSRGALAGGMPKPLTPEELAKLTPEQQKQYREWVGQTSGVSVEPSAPQAAPQPAPRPAAPAAPKAVATPTQAAPAPSAPAPSPAPAPAAPSSPIRGGKPSPYKTERQQGAVATPPAPAQQPAPAGPEGAAAPKPIILPGYEPGAKKPAPAAAAAAAQPSQADQWVSSTAEKLKQMEPERAMMFLRTRVSPAAARQIISKIRESEFAELGEVPEEYRQTLGGGGGMGGMGGMGGQRFGGWNPLYSPMTPHGLGQMAAGYSPFSPRGFYDLDPARKQELLNQTYQTMGFTGGYPEFEAMQRLQTELGGRMARNQMLSNLRRRIIAAGGV